MSDLNNAVIVIWDDAASYDSWDMNKELKTRRGLVRCATIGFILEDTAESIKLIRSFHVSGETSEGMFTIPKGMVVSIIPVSTKQVKGSFDHLFKVTYP